MKKRISLFLCIALMLSLWVLPAEAATGLTPESVMDGILANALEKSGADTIQQWLDTGLSEGAGKGTEWYVFALLERGEALDYSRFAAALQDYADTHTVSNASTRERIALCFRAMGYVSPYTEEAANNSIGQLGLMSYVFGLHLRNNGVNCSLSAEEIIDAIVELEKEDGGWAISGTKGDPDATAMVLQAFAPHREQEAVAEAIERGLRFLSENQLDNGAYRSFGQECPESICQVIVALCTLGIDPLDETYQKNGITLLDALYAYRLEDGTFKHTPDGESNNMSTMEVLYTLASYESYLRGGKALYEFDAPTMDISEAQKKAAEPLPTEAPIVEEPAEIVPEKKEPLLSGKKLYLAMGAGIAALAACAWFFFSGKRHAKNYLFVLLVFALALYLILTVRIEKTEDYYQSGTVSGETVTATISIRCDVIAGEKDYIPADGTVLAPTEITLSAGSTAYDQLVEACKSHSIHLDKEESAFGSAYVKGLANIYEFDFGDLSGWMYCVNGKYADVGAGEYKLRDGDSVEWRYTKELGKDIGDEYME